MDLATVVLFFPLLGGVQQSESLAKLLENYPERTAASSAASLIASAEQRLPAERPIAAFLLGNDLAELGLTELATRELRPLLESPDLGAPAFLALARLLDADGEDESLLRDAQRARWNDLGEEEFAEVSFRMARACMREQRYAESRDWLSKIPKTSPYFAPSRYLLAQTEYALGRLPRSLEAVESVYGVPVREPSGGWLQDRTAIFTGEMLTEIGLYADAVAVLEWPSPGSPYRERAEREAAIARTLATVRTSPAENTSTDAATILPDRVVATYTSEEREKIARDLENAWPSRPLRDARRRFAATAARRAYDSGFGLDRGVEVLWRSFPPVILYEAFRAAGGEPTKTEPTVGDETRFFFTPRPEVAKLLTAVRLVSEPSSKDACAARALRARAASTLSASEPPPTRAELAALANRCEEKDPGQMLPALRAKLDRAIEEDVARAQRELRAQRYLLEEGLAAARLERQAMLQAARGEKR